MKEIVGVRFKSVGKIYYFSPGSIKANVGDRAIVETVRGIECGEVVIANREIDDSMINSPLKPIIRLADSNDLKTLEKNKQREKDAFRICEEKIAARKLKMNLVDVECTFDNNKLLFYFTAENRVDFRELVKDLASVFRTRIELRQIGVRDEAKILGGLGICGREFCCHSFQSDFVPVSIRMAKDQNLSLNPTKISGSCGRLMCCIKYEEDAYLDLSKKLPKVGDEGTTEDGHHCVVDSINILKQRIRVIVDLDDDEREAREYGPGDIKFTRRKKKNNNKNNEQEVSAEELKALKELEKE